MVVSASVNYPEIAISDRNDLSCDLSRQIPEQTTSSDLQDIYDWFSSQKVGFLEIFRDEVVRITRNGVKTGATKRVRDSMIFFRKSEGTKPTRIHYGCEDLDWSYNPSDYSTKKWSILWRQQTYRDMIAEKEAPFLQVDLSGIYDLKLYRVVEKAYSGATASRV